MPAAEKSEVLAEAQKQLALWKKQRAQDEKTAARTGGQLAQLLDSLKEFGLSGVNEAARQLEKRQQLCAEREAKLAAEMAEVQKKRLKELED